MKKRITTEMLIGKVCSEGLVEFKRRFPKGALFPDDVQTCVDLGFSWGHAVRLFCLTGTVRYCLDRRIYVKHYVKGEDTTTKTRYARIIKGRYRIDVMPFPYSTDGYVFCKNGKFYWDRGVYGYCLSAKGRLTKNGYVANSKAEIKMVLDEKAKVIKKLKKHYADIFDEDYQKAFGVEDGNK